MRRYRFDQFGLENLKLEEIDPPQPGAGEVLVNVQAISLNYRDFMVVTGVYNPKLELPAVPISDGAGVVAAVGEGVEGVKEGDRIVSHFIAGWANGPFRAEYRRSTLGTPGSGMAAEQVVLPAEAVVPIPQGYDFAQAATLPIAALTAWSALVTVGRVQSGQTVLTLGTGGVSIFALQLAQAMKAQVIITSSSDEKLQRARELGAAHGINYKSRPDWEAAVLEVTDGRGADITVETAGAQTLNQSMAATASGGTVGFLGALTGLQGDFNAALLLSKRLHLAGIFVDSRAAFVDMNRFLELNPIEPLIDRTFGFEELGEAFGFMERGEHLGKIVVQVRS